MVQTLLIAVMMLIGVSGALIGLSSRPGIILFPKTTRRFLNRVIFEKEELQYGSTVSVTMKKSDRRAQHIANILKLGVGDTLRVGVANEGFSNAAVITSMEPHLKVELGVLAPSTVPPPPVDLIMALPRPQKLERLLPIISCLGVRNLFLVNAKKVEKDYFGSHLLQTPAKMHDLLLDGLAQAEVDIQVPTVSVHRNLREFLTSHMETVVPADSSYRLVAHPPILEYRANSLGLSTQSDSEQRIGGCGSALTVSTSYVKSQDSLRFSEYTAQLAADTSSSAAPSAPRRMLLAVGPEGGWVQQEVALFQQQAFQLVHLGPRILRGDIAVPVLLGLANEFLAGLEPRPSHK